MKETIFTLGILVSLSVTLITGCSSKDPGKNSNGERQPVNVHVNTTSGGRTCNVPGFNHIDCNVVEEKAQDPSSNQYVDSSANYYVNPAMSQPMSASKMYVIQVGVNLTE